jgi:hypothetical protein
VARAVLSSLAGAADGADGGASPGPGRDERGRPGDAGGSPVGRTVSDIVEVVPSSIKIALAALVALCAMFGAGSLFSATRARRLARQRGDLLKEVGLLQSVLLPPVPDTLGSVRTSVAYRPAEGLAAGGDFYDALALPGDRAAFILGDVSGHGQEALDRTAFVRYTLRAYVEAGLEPRAALQVAGRVVGEHLGGDFVTVVIAVHDPTTGSLTYAAAGHPAPIVVGPQAFEPVLAASSPPIGIGVPTGLRQTSLPFPAGAIACLYTDGLTEARTAGGGILGRGRLGDIVAELGPSASARRLLERISEEASTVGDDMAACLFVPTGDALVERPRIEELEVSASDLGSPVVGRFLDACGADAAGLEAAEAAAREAADRHGGALLHVVLDGEPEVEVFPRGAESILAASRRVVAG